MSATPNRRAKHPSLISGRRRPVRRPNLPPRPPAREHGALQDKAVGILHNGSLYRLQKR